MNQDVRTATHHDLHAVETVIHAAYVHDVARIGRKPGPMLDDYGALIDNGQVHVVEHAGIVQGALVLIPKTDSMLLVNVAMTENIGLYSRIGYVETHRAQEKGLRRV